MAVKDCSLQDTFWNLCNFPARLNEMLLVCIECSLSNNRIYFITNDSNVAI